MDSFTNRVVNAVAYRMHLLSGVEPQTARLQVRDFLSHGIESKHSPHVISAAQELYGPVMRSALSMMPSIISVIKSITETEISNGEALAGKLTEHKPS